MHWIEDAPAPPALAVPPGELWIFGYGSLMWNPGFPYDAVEPATVRDWHRAFCIHSAGHRGTPEWPGLVVALAPGGECRGLAFRVEARHKGSALAYLWEREMALAEGYRPHRLAAAFDDNRRLEALTFVADPAHEAYAGELPLATAARQIAAARGARGSNRDYLRRTLEQLDRLGIRDAALSALDEAVGAIPGLDAIVPLG
ncbi:MAG TPA: gamma-glutamylcyclotransferase [Aliidongia sp.]|nr:gamma-glutamylcyclotransferase [Aliidongia sp.]